MKFIPLTMGKMAVVDDGDFDRLCGHKWHAIRRGRIFYAARDEVRAGKRAKVLMHREIINAAPGTLVDQNDHDGLNNRRRNLRVASRSQNGANSISARGTSRFKGVFWEKQSGKWRAGVIVKSRRIHLGRYTDEIAAARAYDAGARRHYGEFARLNFEEAV